MSKTPDDMVRDKTIVEAVYSHDGSLHRIGHVVGYSQVPQFLIECLSGEQFCWREDLVRPASANTVEQYRASVYAKADANEEQPVTLDDLPAAELYTLYVSDPEWLTCVRCGCSVWDDGDSVNRQAHERWHAAIETQAVTYEIQASGRRFVPNEQQIAETIVSALPVVESPGSRMLQTPTTPEQRRELVIALGLDPNRAGDCTWGVVIERARHLADVVAKIARQAGAPMDTGVVAWVQQQTNLVEDQARELEHARTISEALVAAGARAGHEVEWIQQQANRETESGSQATIDLLSLADVTVTAEQVQAWTPEQREQAERWAALEHLDASDNDVEVPPRPEFLP